MILGFPIASAIVAACILLSIKLWDHFYNQKTRDLKDLVTISKDLSESTAISQKDREFIDKLLAIKTKEFITHKSQLLKLDAQTEKFKDKYLNAMWIGIISIFIMSVSTIIYFVLLTTGAIGKESWGFFIAIFTSFSILLFCSPGLFRMKKVISAGKIGFCSRKCIKNGNRCDVCLAL